MRRAARCRAAITQACLIRGRMVLPGSGGVNADHLGVLAQPLLRKPGIFSRSATDCGAVAEMALSRLLLATSLEVAAFRHRDLLTQLLQLEEEAARDRRRSVAFLAVALRGFFGRGLYGSGALLHEQGVIAVLRRVEPDQVEDGGAVVRQPLFSHPRQFCKLLYGLRPRLGDAQHEVVAHDEIGGLSLLLRQPAPPRPESFLQGGVLVACLRRRRIGRDRRLRRGSSSGGLFTSQTSASTRPLRVGASTG